MTIIEVSGLTKSYGDRTVLDGVDLSVHAGEIHGLLGRNGSGKTTTVECIAGLRVPDGGTVRVRGLDPRRDARRVRQVLGVQLQHGALPGDLRVREAVELFASFYDKPLPWRPLLESLGLADEASTPFRRLSGGLQQRVSIALALIGGPQVVILDELTTGLDPDARRDVWNVIEDIRERGVTILLVSHFMAEVERLCDRVAILDAGRIVALDSPSRLTARVADGHRVTFRATGDLSRVALESLPGVTGVHTSGPEVVVTGDSEVLAVVTTALAAAGLRAEDLRLERPTLDDAFLALTGRTLGAGDDA